MPRRIVRIGLAFTLAGVVIPLLLLLIYGAAVYHAAPATRLRYTDLAVFLWPTGMALVAESGRQWTPVERCIATLVTIVENAVLYAVLGFFLGWTVNWFWPDPHRFDETAAEDALAQQQAARTAAQHAAHAAGKDR